MKKLLDSRYYHEKNWFKHHHALFLFNYNYIGLEYTININVFKFRTVRVLQFRRIDVKR